MSQIHQVAQLLFSCWIVANGERSVPTTSNILDRALKRLVDQDVLPLWARDQLHFAHGRTGLECIELPEILREAQDYKLTSAPNPSYHFTALAVSDTVAKWQLRRLNIAEKDAETWGTAFAKAVDEEASLSNSTQPLTS